MDFLFPLNSKSDCNCFISSAIDKKAEKLQWETSLMWYLWNESVAVLSGSTSIYILKICYQWGRPPPKEINTSIEVGLHPRMHIPQSSLWIHNINNIHLAQGHMNNLFCELGFLCTFVSMCVCKRDCHRVFLSMSVCILVSVSIYTEQAP